MNDLPITELTCREMVELVSDYLEGALADHDRARFEQHLVLCEGCTAYLDQMRRTVALVGRLRDHVLDPPSRDRLLETFRTWAGG
ncbi:MAG TPA: zf-HC2 domain-containing protein [Gaiellales bacterium]